MRSTPTLSGLLRRVAQLAVFSGLMPVMAAHAVSYFKWEAVELPASSGASCGNGSPYRFFVNRTPFTSKTVVMFEGGGACWDQAACLNKGGLKLAAVNPNGIPADYMQVWDYQAHLGLVTPFTMRLHPLQSVQTQSWNIVYVTYCTGDVFTGNKVTTYNDADPANPTAWFHRGAVNAKAVSDWMAKNLPRPDHLLLTGFSAGGVGSSASYPYMRTKVNPKKGALLADSGPLFWAPRGSTPEESPSLPLHEKIRVVWGLDGPEGLVTELFSKYPGIGDPNNLGSANFGIGKIFPQDRFGLAMFQEDANFSAYSYEKFYPDIANAPTEADKLARLNQRWRQDIATLVSKMPTSAAQPNLGYYIPNFRNINQSHCLTIVTFGGTGIDELRIKDVGVFLDNLLDGKGAVMRAAEADRTSKPMTFSDLLAYLIGALNLI